MVTFQRHCRRDRESGGWVRTRNRGGRLWARNRNLDLRNAARRTSRSRRDRRRISRRHRVSRLRAGPASKGLYHRLEHTRRLGPSSGTRTGCFCLSGGSLGGRLLLRKGTGQMFVATELASRTRGILLAEAITFQSGASATLQSCYITTSAR